jgi:hypothetical protein
MDSMASSYAVGYASNVVHDGVENRI